MKILIAEDDSISRFLLQELLVEFGAVQIATNGKEAVDAVKLASDINDPYDLICLDIMMPEMNGLEALIQIRKQEEAMGIQFVDGAKIFMVTALKDLKNISYAFNELCNAYLTKPVDKKKLHQELRNFDLIE